MSFQQIKDAVKMISDDVCKTGVLPAPLKRTLKNLDEKVNEFQDSATDNEMWMNCFYLREEISGLLDSEAALYA
jgi:hypothetical protein